jgi:hypothetical protein
LPYVRVATTRKALGARAVVVRGGAGHAGGMGQGLFKQKPTKTMQKLNEIMIFWRKKKGASWIHSAIRPLNKRLA